MLTLSAGGFIILSRNTSLIRKKKKRGLEKYREIFSGYVKADKMPGNATIPLRLLTGKKEMNYFLWKLESRVYYQGV